MFMFSGYPASVLRWRQGPVISGFLTFMDRYRDEAACIAALAELRWPNGFICAGCVGRLAYQLAARPRVFDDQLQMGDHGLGAGGAGFRLLAGRAFRDQCRLERVDCVGDNVGWDRHGHDSTTIACPCDVSRNG